MNSKKQSIRQFGLSLLTGVIFILLATACNLLQPAPDKFSFRSGDYSVYENVQLDTNGNVVANTTTRSTRTVIRTGVSIGGQTDAALTIDSVFATSGSLSSVDTTYYRVQNDEVFTYFNINSVSKIVGGLGTGAISTAGITGFEPKWVKLGETKDAAGTADFPTTEISATITVPAFGALALVAKFTGRNQGATDITIGTNKYRAYRQTQTLAITMALPVIGRLELATPITYDLGIPTQSSTPRTIIRTEQKAVSTTLQLVGDILLPGSRSTLTSFRAGSTF